MNGVHIRPAEHGDLPRLTEIYNYYVINTPVTFDVEPYSVERREPWFAQFAKTGRYRLLVAETVDVIVGYAGTTDFVPSPLTTRRSKQRFIARRKRLGRELEGFSTRRCSKRYAARIFTDLWPATRCRTPRQRPSTSALDSKW
jgi:hypothetical protein